MPFVLVALVAIHLIFLHEYGSNNPLGVHFNVDSVNMYPYYIVKDLFGVILFFLFSAVFVFFAPNYLGHPDNYIPANAMVTPAHIVPEWYSLPFYAILRSIPSKLGGVIALLAAILSLLLLPYIFLVDLRSSVFRPISKFLVWCFLIVVIFLGWVGGKPVEDPFLTIGQLATLFYFCILLIYLPLAGMVEKILWEKI
jgi:quinol-cytochrome oxidoreductase complex cytochrome b subunit